MQYKTLIFICIISYIVLGLGVFFGAKLITDKKDDKLRQEAYDNLNAIFDKQEKFVRIAYSGNKVSYERTEIPKYKHDVFIDKDKQQYEWEEDYGDIYKMYKLKPKYESDDKWTGFRFDVISSQGLGVINTYQIYPYMIGYRKQSQSYMYNYMPSIQSAVDDAFDFWSSDDKSSYKKYIDDNIFMHDIEDAVENEYYMLFSYEDCCRFFDKEYTDSLVRATGVRYSVNFNYEAKDYGYMYNGYYKVYNVAKPISNYTLNYNVFSNPKWEDRKNIMILGYSILSGLILSIVIPLSIKENKRKKHNAESLKDKLLRISNPQNYLSPYQEQKVNAANGIYARLQNISIDDIISLKEIRKEISDKLEVSFIDSDLLKELQRKCNPKNFMNPYDEEKIRIANLLYGKLVNDNLTIDELEDIQKEYEIKLKS